MNRVMRNSIISVVMLGMAFGALLGPRPWTALTLLLGALGGYVIAWAVYSEVEEDLQVVKNDITRNDREGP